MKFLTFIVMIFSSTFVLSEVFEDPKPLFSKDNPNFVESSKEDLYYHIDGHAKPAGHAVIAQQIYDYLVGMTVVP